MGGDEAVDRVEAVDAGGVIQVGPGRRGYVVRNLDAEEIRQTFEARETVEGAAARIAAKFGHEAAEHVRAAITEAQEYDVDTALGSYDANRTVHRSIVEAAKNDLLLEFFDSLWNRGRSHSLYAKCFADAGGTEAVRTKHAPILRALAAGDPDAAEREAVEHVRAGLKGLGIQPGARP